MRVAAVTLLTGVLVSLAGSVAASPGTAAETRRVLDLGDSLGVGTAPYLRARLRGYRLTRLHDVGMHAYDAAEVVTARRTSLPDILVVSAGTNDDPRIVSTFWRSATSIARAAGPGRCVVWPTIHRPDAVGASYAGFNHALRRVAAKHANVVLVDWAQMVAGTPAGCRATACM